MIAIRREAPGDEAAIRAVHTAAFPTGAEAQLVDAMRANGHATVSLVALLDDRIVGHVSFSPVTIRTRGRAAVHFTGLGLAPISRVLCAHSRRSESNKAPSIAFGAISCAWYTGCSRCLPAALVTTLAAAAGDLSAQRHAH